MPLFWNDISESSSRSEVKYPFLFFELSRWRWRQVVPYLFQSVLTLAPSDLDTFVGCVQLLVHCRKHLEYFLLPPGHTGPPVYLDFRSLVDLLGGHISPDLVGFFAGLRRWFVSFVHEPMAVLKVPSEVGSSSESPET